MFIEHSTIYQVLDERFNFKTFRPGQLEAISALLQYKSLLSIQPTGYGKSLLYQLPSVLLEGMTVVISPLLALMRDQIQQLQTRFNIPAASINSDQTPEEDQAARTAASAGKIKILFIAPEQLDHIDRFNFLIQLAISLVVVDEAHCISTWGHDFRPAYRHIIQFVHALRQNHPEIHVLGLTATANDKTAADIKDQLSDKEHSVILQRSCMDRPNIQLSVIHADSLAHKLHYLIRLLPNLAGSGLIYCATRENTILVAEYLQQQHISAAAYHAGFLPPLKQKIQQDFLKDTYKVIVATNALGMGIDKTDLRFVIHFDVPSSITAYYQEIGRAGRDGFPAQGILLFDIVDKKIQDHFIDAAQPDIADFNMILNTIQKTKPAPGLTEIKRLTGLHPTRITVVVAELIEQTYIVKSSQEGKQVYHLSKKQGLPNLSRYQNQYLIRQQELAAMIHYAQQNETCLMQLLRQALGDLSENSCGHCDICNKKIIPIETDSKSIRDINNWLQQRPIVIDAIKTYKTEAGVSVLDGKLRSTIFIDFMRQRAAILPKKTPPLAPELLTLLKKYLMPLKQKYHFSALLVIPSHTWTARAAMATWLSQELGMRLFLDYLYWRKTPDARQGELLNNDQRRYNVSQHMTCWREQPLPAGALLLLDDYIGSGATLTEAVRVLRKESHFQGEIFPFTIAQVKWRLGKAGMI